jgi:hypothetical protein
MSIRRTVSLRCQRCDGKLHSAPVRQIPQLIRRTCKPCDQDWSVRLVPVPHVVDGQLGILTRAYYAPVSP